MKVYKYFFALSTRPEAGAKAVVFGSFAYRDGGTRRARGDRVPESGPSTTPRCRPLLSKTGAFFTATLARLVSLTGAVCCVLISDLIAAYSMQMSRTCRLERGSYMPVTERILHTDHREDGI